MTDFIHFIETDFIRFFMKKMGKGLIELTCAGMVNIPGVQ